MPKPGFRSVTIRESDYMLLEEAARTHGLGPAAYVTLVARRVRLTIEVDVRVLPEEEEGVSSQSPNSEHEPNPAGQPRPEGSGPARAGSLAVAGAAGGPDPASPRPDPAATRSADGRRGGRQC